LKDGTNISKVLRMPKLVLHLLEIDGEVEYEVLVYADVLLVRLLYVALSESLFWCWVLHTSVVNSVFRVLHLLEKGDVLALRDVVLDVHVQETLSHADATLD